MSERDWASFVFGSSALLTQCLKLQKKLKYYTNHKVCTDGCLIAGKIPEMTHHRFSAFTQTVEASKCGEICMWHLIYNIKTKTLNTSLPEVKK